MLKISSKEEKLITKRNLLIKRLKVTKYSLNIKNV